jgi:hypothetical protein
MTRDRSTARGQHHVLVMLQDAFAAPGNGKKRQIHVFDKHEDRTFRTSPENILQERDFNTFENGEVTYCLEDGMGKIEDQAAPALRKVIANRTLACLDDKERAAILVFTALQRIRGVHTRAGMLDIETQIRERLRSNGDDPDLVPQLRGSNEPEQIKLSALTLVGKNLPEFSRSYTNKVMVLMEACPGETFLLGDTPVVLANQNDTFPYGNLGLEVKGIEIYLPISPDLTIAFWCPSIISLIETALRRCEEAIKNTNAVALLGVGPDAQKLRELHPQLKVRAAKLREDLGGIKSQGTLKNAPENMEYMNSLQVAYAERYVLSSTGDFALAKRMIAENSGYRRGHRWQLA